MSLIFSFQNNRAISRLNLSFDSHITPTLLTVNFSTNFLCMPALCTNVSNGVSKVILNSTLNALAGGACTTTTRLSLAGNPPESSHTSWYSLGPASAGKGIP